jgi:hypothetical protein
MYAPGNVRWISRADNARNRSDSIRHGGVTLPQLAHQIGMAPATLNWRFNKGLLGGSGHESLTSELGQSLRPKVKARDHLLTWALSTAEVVVDDGGRVFDTKRWKAIEPSLDARSGYYYIKLSKACIARYKAIHTCSFPHANRFALHRLLAIHWFGPPAEPWTLVDHINHNTTDNRRENLRWVTAQLSACNREAIARDSTATISYESRPAPKKWERTERWVVKKQKPLYAQFERADQLMMHFSEHVQRSTLKDDMDLARCILASPSNEPREVGGHLYITVLTAKGVEVERSLSSADASMCRTDRVRLACATCGFESPGTRPEIRDKMTGDKRYHKASCSVCSSLGAVAPHLAGLLSADPRTGRIDDPLRVPARTSGIRAWFRCGEPGCTCLAGTRAVKGLVARHVVDGALPTCEAHRSRLSNFAGSGDRVVGDELT